jgi:NAD-dependent deacetylase
MDSMDPIEHAAALFLAAKRAVAFTGAGISTESGIPDFRSPGGTWSRYDPEEFSYQRFLTRSESRRKYWAFGLELWPTVRDAQPNAGHHALAALETAGRLRCVITQNIDGLHQRAGSRDVIELHGTTTRVGCLSCDADLPRDEVHARLLAGDLEPRCVCGGLLNPRTISFGQPMPEKETRRAFDEARRCDLLLTVGSSLVVFPAADLVPTARAHGAKVILVNLSPTPFDDLADVVVRGKAGESLAAIAGKAQQPPIPSPPV